MTILSGPSLDGPARRGAVRLWPAQKLTALAVVLAIAGLVAAPLISLIRIALIGDAEIAGHLVAYVLPVALTQTALLLIGVAVISSLLGASTAWTVSYTHLTLPTTPYV